MKPKELADALDIDVQRVSDWMSKRRQRKVPRLAVVAMAAMGLL